MRIRKFYYYIMLLIGAALVIYTQSSPQEDPYVLIIGFCLLMAGLFGVYSSIKGSKPDYDPYAVQNDEEE